MNLFERLYGPGNFREMAKVTQADIRKLDPKTSMANRQAYLNKDKEELRSIQNKWFEEHPEALDELPNRSPNKAWTDATHNSIYNGIKKDEADVMAAARIVDTFDRLPNYKVGILDIVGKPYKVEIKKGLMTRVVPGMLVLTEVSTVIIPPPLDGLCSDSGFYYRQLGKVDVKEMTQILVDMDIIEEDFEEDFDYPKNVLGRKFSKLDTYKCITPIELEYSFDTSEYKNEELTEGAFLSKLSPRGEQPNPEVYNKLVDKIQTLFIDKIDMDELFSYRGEGLDNSTIRKGPFNPPEGLDSLDITFNKRDGEIEFTIKSTGDVNEVEEWLERSLKYYLQNKFGPAVKLGVRGNAIITHEPYDPRYDEFNQEYSDLDWYETEETVDYLLIPSVIIYTSSFRKVD